MTEAKSRSPNAALAGLAAACMLTTSCAVPTLAQREQAWRTHRDTQRLICATGLNTDPSMPGDVATWCARVVEP
jgi:hypothetical protein